MQVHFCPKLPRVQPMREMDVVCGDVLDVPKRDSPNHGVPGDSCGTEGYWQIQGTLCCCSQGDSGPTELQLCPRSSSVTPTIACAPYQTSPSSTSVTAHWELWGAEGAVRVR